MGDERLCSMSIDTEAVLDQFIALKNRKNEFYLKQTKIKLYSVVGYLTFLLHVFDQHSVRSMGLIN